MPTPASLHSSISSHNSFGSTTTSPTIVNSDTAGESVYEAPSLSVPVASHHELHHHSIKDADRTWGLLDAVANILPVWRYKDQSEEHNPLIPIPSPPEAESPLSLTDKYGKVKDVIILRRDIDNTGTREAIINNSPQNRAICHQGIPSLLSTTNSEPCKFRILHRIMSPTSQHHPYVRSHPRPERLSLPSDGIL